MRLFFRFFARGAGMRRSRPRGGRCRSAGSSTAHTKTTHAVIIFLAGARLRADVESLGLGVRPGQLCRPCPRAFGSEQGVSWAGRAKPGPERAFTGRAQGKTWAGLTLQCSPECPRAPGRFMDAQSVGFSDFRLRRYLGQHRGRFRRGLDFSIGVQCDLGSIWSSGNGEDRQ